MTAYAYTLCAPRTQQRFTYYQNGLSSTKFECLEVLPNALEGVPSCSVLAVYYDEQPVTYPSCSVLAQCPVLLCTLPPLTPLLLYLLS